MRDAKTTRPQRYWTSWRWGSEAGGCRRARSRTKSSLRLKKCAIDLNVFQQVDGRARLTYDVPKLKPIGEYWENLRPGKNSWGGNWNSFKDVPHFERRV